MKYLAAIILITIYNTSGMALEIKTVITIHATLNKVWEILTNFKAYPEWNSFIKSIKGQVLVGEKISARIEPPNAKGMTFKPKIVTFIKNKELSWVGHLLFPSLFDGKHKFELIDKGNGTLTFIQSEIFSGILVALFKKKLKINTKNGFVAISLAPNKFGVLF